jgi:hypothetical protein
MGREEPSVNPFLTITFQPRRQQRSEHIGTRLIEHSLAKEHKLDCIQRSKSCRHVTLDPNQICFLNLR